MRQRLWAFALVVALVAAPGWAQDGTAQRVVPLRDGGQVVLRADGAMRHYDAAGSPVAMKEGEVMVARDGSRLLMRNGALWREIVERAAHLYGLASRLPADRGAPIEPRVELADGGWLLLGADGGMMHFNAFGEAIRMSDGDVMIAKDGARILMNNGALWSSASPGSPKSPAR